MSNPASPLLVLSKEFPNDNKDKLWEEAFAKMDKQEPLFEKLPSSEKDAKMVFAKCSNKSHVGPIVLAKGIPVGVFSSWLRKSELGLHKAVRLGDGTVYVPQECAQDHGKLRGLLHDSQHFPILIENNAIFLKHGSDTEGNQNPDVFWHRSDEPQAGSRVLFKVGISQSLPSLRRQAYALCKTKTTWQNLVYVVLVKRYEVRCLYVEIWRRIPRQAGVDNEPDFFNEQRAPGKLNLQETMQFVENAHAYAEGIPQNPTLAWQFALPDNCEIPAGDDLLVGGAAVTLDAQVLLNKCKYTDQA